MIWLGLVVTAFCFFFFGFFVAALLAAAHDPKADEAQKDTHDDAAIWISKGGINA